MAQRGRVYQRGGVCLERQSVRQSSQSPGYVNRRDQRGFDGGLVCCFVLMPQPHCAHEPSVVGWDVALVLGKRGRRQALTVSSSGFHQLALAPTATPTATTAATVEVGRGQCGLLAR